MGDSSVIEWTDSTWNPWRGCDKVSPGCADCYMFRDQLRYGRDPKVVVRAADGTFFAPVRSKKWKEAREEAIRERGRHFVFTCSWSDWFHEDADDWRDEAWEIVRETPDSIYQILTKRPERIAEHLPEDWGDGYPNVWLGVTIENRRFVGRADLLRAAPAAVRFISAEPLLGPLVFDREVEAGDGKIRLWSDGADVFEHQELNLDGMDWIIVGGESGGPERRMLVEKRDGEWVPRDRAKLWVSNLLWATRCDRCLGLGVNMVPNGCFSAAPEPCPDCGGWELPSASQIGKRGSGNKGTSFFFKQWGGPTPKSGGRLVEGTEYGEMPTAGLDPVLLARGA